MQMTQPLPLGTVGRQMPGGIDQRVEESRARARRRWIFRTSAFLFLTSILLVLLVLWRRDSMQVQVATSSMYRPCKAIQARVNELGVLPAVVEEDLGRGVLYAGDTERFYAVNAGRPAIVAAGPIIDLILHRNGRCVILYDQGRLSVRWMTTPEYAQAVERQRHDMQAFYDARRARPPQVP